MLRVILFVLFMFGFSHAVEIPDSLLTPEQKALVSAKTSQAVASSWVGIGKEVGEAVNGSMSAITENTNKFANTPVGRYTIWIVTYYVLKGVLKSIFIIVLFGAFWLISNLYMRYVICKDEDKYTYKDVLLGFHIVSSIIYALVLILAIGSI